MSQSGDGTEVTVLKSTSLPVRLGVVSFLNDCSSEILQRSLPLYLTIVLGLSPTVLGIVEGLSETILILCTGLSGWMSDRMSSRKPLVVAGYVVSAMSRSVMIGSQVWWLMAGARVSDRIGKGVRTAPRDALIADASHSGNVGKAFGIARALDTIGAVTGLTLALLLGLGEETMTRGLFARILAISIPFAWAAVLVLHFWVPRLQRAAKARIYLTWHIPTEIRFYLVAVGVFSLGMSSDAFLILRARELGFTFSGIIVLFIYFNVFAATLAWKAGPLSDKYGRRWFLAAGWLVYVVTYAGMAWAPDQMSFAIMFAIYGAFYGLTEGVEKALVAQLLPADKRGLGFGALQMTLALVAIPANLVTGALASRYGVSGGLLFSCTASFLGILLLARIFGRLKTK